MSSKPINIRRRIQQRVKGTHDSPCLSICTHKQGDVVCRGCGMLREEKRGWKCRSELEKDEIRLKAKSRMVDVEVSMVGS